MKQRKPVRIILRATGGAAPDNMRPGEYLATCTKAGQSQRGGHLSAVLTFEVIARVTERDTYHDFDGVALRQWLDLGEAGARVATITPHSKYGRSWSLAAGRAMKASESPDEVEFVGKTFRVVVGYSSRDSGGYSYRNTFTKKYDKDFLRVHEILEKVTEKGQTHMGPYEASNTEHEHKTQSIKHILNTNSNTNIPSIRSAPMNDEQIAHGHANDGETGHPTKKESPPSPPYRPYLPAEVIDPDDPSETEEPPKKSTAEKKSPATLELVKSVFPGARARG